MAWLIDQLLIWICYVAIVYVGIQVMQAVSQTGESQAARNMGSIATALIILGFFITDFSYFVYFEHRWAGQSPGKRRFKIRVMSATGTRLRFADVLVRNLMRPIDQLPFAMVVGGSVMMLDKYHRRLGDLLADTIIVRDAQRVIPQAMASEKSRENSFQTDAVLRARILNRVGKAERDLILDLAIRRDQMDPTVRKTIFAQAAEHFREQLGISGVSDYLSDEQTVINLAMVLQDAKFTA